MHWQKHLANAYEGPTQHALLLTDYRLSLSLHPIHRSIKDVTVDLVKQEHYRPADNLHLSEL